MNRVFRLALWELVDTVTEKLAPGGHIFAQTDIEFLADEMLALFKENERLSEIEEKL